MRDRTEQLGRRRRADRWVGESGAISREPTFERAELPDQLVVLGVGDLRVVEDVVPVQVVVDLLAELLDPRLGFGEFPFLLREL